jgi:hypothetical protein
LSAVLSPRLAPIADALIAKSNGKYDDQFLRILVANVANEFEDAPVQDYVEVLVAKQAADELRKLDALQSISQ